jgi:hypothetical protein
MRKRAEVVEIIYAWIVTEMAFQIDCAERIRKRTLVMTMACMDF